MSDILYITASMRADDSVSRSLGEKLVDRLSQSGGTVTRRDLGRDALPHVTDAQHQANLTPAADRTPEQAELAKAGDALIAELQAADTIVIATPIYNFNVPAPLKTWADLVARAGTTFRYTENGPEGLLTGKKAYIAIASGGTPVGSDIDHMSGWLKFFLGFLGITDVRTVAADGIMGEGGEEKIAEAHAEVETIAA